MDNILRRAAKTLHRHAGLIRWGLEKRITPDLLSHSASHRSAQACLEEKFGSEKAQKAARKTWEKELAGAEAGDRPHLLAGQETRIKVAAAISGASL